MSVADIYVDRIRRSPLCFAEAFRADLWSAGEGVRIAAVDQLHRHLHVHDGMFWYKHAMCVICMYPIDKPSSGVVLDCKHHPFHASCIVKSLQRDRCCPVCRHAPASRAEESIQDAAGGEIELLIESDSDDGIDSDEEENEHYEKLVTARVSLSDWTWKR
eukprot:1015895-Prymnesium_polylepis.1